MLGKQTNIEILIMAAGASRRLGQPKQLVDYHGQSLIRRISQEAINAKIGRVTVVTGFNHEEMEKEIKKLLDIRFEETILFEFVPFSQGSLKHLFQEGLAVQVCLQ